MSSLRELILHSLLKAQSAPIDLLPTGQILINKLQHAVFGVEGRLSACQAAS